MSYTYQTENGAHTLPELQPLYHMHYCETEKRLTKEGFTPSPYKPDWGRYIDYWMRGYLIHYNARIDGKAIGYANVYLTTSMHNQDLIAHEDSLFVHPDHRNGVGRKLTLFVLDDLKKRGVKRAVMTARTDPRATKLWKRMGFRETAVELVYDFGDMNDVLRRTKAA